MLDAYNAMMTNTRRVAVGLALVASAFLPGCRQTPKSESYRRIEVSASPGKHTAFVCMIGIHYWKTYEPTTPWVFEVDLDTMHECLCGTHCRVFKTTADSETLWVEGFDRDSLWMTVPLVSPSETLFASLRDRHRYSP